MDHSYSELLTASVELNLSDFEAKLKGADTAMTEFEAAGDFKGKNPSFSGIGNSMVVQAVAALNRFAERVMVESLVEVPKDTGTLADSHHVGPALRVGNRVKLTMGYGYGDEVNPNPRDVGRVAAQYAVPVHEIRDATHEPPTKDHYLIDPLIVNAPRFGPDVAASMKIGATLAVVGGSGREATVITEYVGKVATGVIPFGGGTTVRGPGGRFIKVSK